MSTELVDQIVRNVLAQLHSRAVSAVRPESTASIDQPVASVSRIHLPPETVASLNHAFPATSVSKPLVTAPAVASSLGSSVTLTEAVITAELLSRLACGAARVFASAKSIVTPAAKDWLRDHHVVLERGLSPANSTLLPKAAGNASSNKASNPSSMAAKWVLGVVSATANVKTFLNSTQTAATVSQVKILGTGTETQEFVSGAIHKAEAHGAILIERSAAKRACDLNRSPAIRAAVVSSLAEVLLTSSDFSPNVYVIDPTLKTFIELRNLVQAIVRTGIPSGTGVAP
ncbi:hypothetical protein Plim_1749 [Planctopirus limnophila DSM 3776]|uniref:Uncharacterized protein n=1 Tax=Planctopirus limnophila (strain ATCC 43296 / DSM 3776 / IFAM 1008 / Mu 290) TaxID=521674 RepID=D5SXL2_PLAL2|nr:hypothetical protein [Planctopirus limnophila]ADG67579.1 hypothetical protein Plim_1749 [Planctopirus limnophila DSM 3776]